MVFDFNKFKTVEELIAEIDKLPTKNYIDTYTGVALRKAKTEYFDKAIQRDDDPARILVLITDGDPTDQVQADAAASEIKKSGIKLMPIAIGDSISDANLKKWSSDETFNLRAQYKTLSSEVAKIADLVCKGKRTKSLLSTIKTYWVSHQVTQVKLDRVRSNAICTISWRSYHASNVTVL